MRILVCGGRDFKNQALLNAELDLLRSHITLLVQGGEPNGADRMARTWAIARGIMWAEEKAEWERYGKAAGPLRNTEMLDIFQPNLVLAFPTGGPGTADMIQQARNRNITCKIIK